MKRAYDDETYLPWYRRTTPTWLELSAAARGVLVSVSMELHNKTGEVTLRRGLPSLATLIRIPWEVLEPALGELIAKGKLEWDGSRFVLRDPEYLDRARPTSKERVARHRLRSAEKAGENQDEEENRKEENRSNVTAVTDAPCNASNACNVTGVTSAPAWFSTAIDVIGMGTGVVLPVTEAWLRYAGHRAGKGIAPTAPDAQYWLTTVMVPEAREVMRRDASDQKRTAAFVAQRSGPEVKPQNSRKAFAERDEWERTAGPPDPETAAKMRALLGKVGT